MTGTPQFSWDLNGDGICETPWTTEFSTVTTFSAVGEYVVKNCAKDDDEASGVWTCLTTVTVYPDGNPPRLKVKMASIQLRDLLKHGAPLRVRWNRDVKARYKVTLSMNTRGSSEPEEYRVRISKKKSTDRRLWLRAFPGWRRLLKMHNKAQRRAEKREPDNIYASQLFLIPDLSRDPVLASISQQIANDNDWYGPLIVER